MSGGITVTEFKHISGVNDTEYIKELEKLQEIDKRIISKAIAKIKMLSAQSERKTGRWIQLTCDSAEWWYCSECNGRVQMNPWVKYNYCPNCGADMKGEEHE